MRFLRLCGLLPDRTLPGAQFIRLLFTDRRQFDGIPVLRNAGKQCERLVKFAVNVPLLHQLTCLGIDALAVILIVPLEQLPAVAERFDIPEYLHSLPDFIRRGIRVGDKRQRPIIEQDVGTDVAHAHEFPRVAVILNQCQHAHRLAVVLHGFVILGVQRFPDFTVGGRGRRLDTTVIQLCGIPIGIQCTEFLRQCKIRAPIGGA